MLFFPYTVDLDLARFPWVTVATCLFCIGMFLAQINSWQNIEESTQSFCSERKNELFRVSLDEVFGDSSPRSCARMMVGLHMADDVDARLEELVTNTATLPGLSAEESREYYSRYLRDEYRVYARRTPGDLTERLLYTPSSWNPMRMISSAFAHSGWVHIIGNLLFFFAFAATVELCIGSLRFVGLMLGSAIFTGIAYSAVSAGMGQDIPTLGLSGVVMSMIALFTFLLPTSKIRCFVWFIMFFRTIAIPAWLLALWFIGWDVYHLVQAGGNNGVNLIAHISGALFGFVVGVLFFRQRKREVRELAAAVA